ncbi:aldo/keto reductase [Arsenicicoccus sp. oral taxon 190]|uniref:aldo/keto reductase n=1 Tax=Arsenicicoccus sp. oral taxon 190 TaxID=1658671 RepID=UPI000679FCBB|nr:aldo/keto reductase [Arsenicicoccus sp. oral taxon 190]AKT51027.1 2,5-diketo-D-gluconic acid reductase [Arsenicicoccus sp. oral taxon 190]
MSTPTTPTTPTAPTCTLNDGTELPLIGFGTYPLRGVEGVEAVTSALQVGYRIVDSAVNYDNETEVGEAVRRAGVPRDEIVVTTKVPGRFHEHDLCVRSVEDSLHRLGLDHLDLVLIHWPNPSVDRFVDAWQALVEVQERGLTRSIGVSNFTEAHLQRVIELTGITPAVNQIELHPAFPQTEMLAVHERLGIRTESWSPLGRADADGPIGSPAVTGAAEAHGVTPAQVILRWHVQLGAVPLPKSAAPERQRSNLDIFGFELSEQEMAAITALGRPDGRLFGADPDSHEEM